MMELNSFAFEASNIISLVSCFLCAGSVAKQSKRHGFGVVAAAFFAFLAVQTGATMREGFLNRKLPPFVQSESLSLIIVAGALTGYFILDFCTIKVDQLINKFQDAVFGIVGFVGFSAVSGNLFAVLFAGFATCLIGDYAVGLCLGKSTTLSNAAATSVFAGGLVYWVILRYTNLPKVVLILATWIVCELVLYSYDSLFATRVGGKKVKDL